MKKLVISFISIVLCLLLSFSAVACGKNNETNVATNTSTFTYTDGRHQFNYQETSRDLVKGGTSEYSIVIPANPTEQMSYIATELQLLFKEATGINLPIITDDSVTYTAQGKFISLGQNSLLKAVGLDDDVLSLNLEKQGYIIKTVDNSIFISGNNDFAATYGMYNYLDIEFNFDCFSNNYYYIDKNVTDLKLKEFDVLDVPDIPVRKLTNPFMSEKAQTMYRMRLTPGGRDISVGDSSAHSSFVYLPKETFQVEHPKWYSIDGTQLCWTARGDSAELKLMQETVFNKMKNSLKGNENGFLLSFTQADKVTWCTCQSCMSESIKYNGSNAAVMVKFCNNLAEMIDAWFETEEGAPHKRDYKLYFLAYNKTLAAPVKYNAEADAYEAIDGLKCHENVSPYVAPIERSFVKSITDKENERFYSAIRGWAAISDELCYFDYMSNYNNFMVSYDIFNTMQESLTMLAQFDCFYYSILGQYGQSGASTGWQVFRSYLFSKLSWNVNANVDQITEDFFKHYYNDGWENMLKYYEEYRIHSKKITDDGTMNATGVYGRVIDKGYFPKNLVERWIGYCNAAIEDIEYLKSVDMAMYNLVYDHIITERVSLYYIMVQQHATSSPSSYIQELKLQCKEDCMRTGITASAEAVPISNIWDAWGIN